MPTLAHRVSSVSLISYLNTKDRTYTLDAAMEIVPSEDPAVNDQVSPEDAAREFASYLVVMFDQAEQKPSMEITLEETSDADTPEELRRQQVLTKLAGTIPEGAKEFLLFLDPRCPMAVVMVVVKDEQPSRRMQVILAGEYSRPVSVLPVEEGDPFAAAKPAEAPASAASVPPSAETGTGGKPAAFASGWRVFFHKSALPVLLVVATLLLGTGLADRLRQLFVLLATQALAFSLAVGFVSVPSWSATALAAATAVLALEVLFHERVRRWRYLLLAGAGTFLGFFLASTASLPFVVRESGVGEILSSLLGTELAALLISLVTLAVLFFLGRFEWCRRAVVVPLAVLVAGYAIFAGVEVYL